MLAVGIQADRCRCTHCQRLLHPAPQCRPFALIDRLTQDFRPSGFGLKSGVIAGTVIDHQHGFDLLPGAMDDPGNGGCFVIGGDNDRNTHERGHAIPPLRLMICPVR